MAITDDFRNLVRLKSGDASTTPLLQDDEIDLLIGNLTSANLAAAEVADALSARFSRSATFAVEGLRIENSVKAENFRKLAQRLRSNAAFEDATIDVSVTGISKDEMTTQDDQTDRVDSKFKIGMHEYPGTNVEPETQQ